MPKTFVKDTQEVLVFTPAQEINLRAQGFTEKVAEEAPVDPPASAPVEKQIEVPPEPPTE